MTSSAMTKLVANRTRMIFDHVFFGVLATRLQFVEDTSIPTLSVDGKNIFFNPDYVLKLSDSLTRSAIAHEVGHCMFEHFSRRRHREPRRWNQAGDYVINLMLKDAGFEISPSWLCSPVYADMSTDEVYNALPPGDEGGDQGPDPQDEVRDGDPGQNAQDEAEWKSAISQAANAAKSRGELPGAVRRFIDELTNPQVPWEEELRAFFTSTDESDYSWAHPNKNFLSKGIYLPTLHGESTGVVVVAVDTSGSISNDVLNTFGAEIKGIVDFARPTEVHVIYCDSRVQHVDTFKQGEELHFELHGGGGTDFKPPFEYVAENGIAPEVLVYLTDLEGPFPDPSDYPVLWCSIADHEAPFGKTIHIRA